MCSMAPAFSFDVHWQRIFFDCLLDHFGLVHTHTHTLAMMIQLMIIMIIDGTGYMNCLFTKKQHWNRLDPCPGYMLGYFLFVFFFCLLVNIFGCK